MCLELGGCWLKLLEAGGRVQLHFPIMGCVTQKRSLMSWFVVIPKEGWACVAMPVLLLVWHRLVRFFFLIFDFFFKSRDLFAWCHPSTLQSILDQLLSRLLYSRPRAKLGHQCLWDSLHVVCWKATQSCCVTYIHTQRQICVMLNCWMADMCCISYAE